jgi:hypothetical protein
MEVVREAGSPRKAVWGFDDLRQEAIVKTWHTLNRWIDERGFPPGRMIGRFRRWTPAEVMAWVEAQPTAKAPLRGCAKQLASNSGGTA